MRLWVDDASALAWMAPQGCPGVQVQPWPLEAHDRGASQGVVDGDAVHGTYTESRRVLRDLGAAGVAYDELTAGLERRVAEEARAAWAELVAAAAQRLQTVA